MINNCVLMGRLTKDPELKTIPSGKSVVSFCVAVDNGYGESKKTSFIDCVAWERRAEFIERYFHKGNLIALQGELQTRTYESNGVNRKVTELRVESVSFCGDKGEILPESKPIPSIEVEDEPQQTFMAADMTEDDLPF